MTFKSRVVSQFVLPSDIISQLIRVAHYHFAQFRNIEFCIKHGEQNDSERLSQRRLEVQFQAEGSGSGQVAVGNIVALFSRHYFR